MAHISWQQLATTQPVHRMPRSIIAVLTLGVTLSLTLGALVARRTPVAHAAAWPYTALQAELNATYADVQHALAPLPVIPTTNYYAVPLFWADSSAGVGLIGTNGNLVKFTVQRCTTWLQFMKRAGFNSIGINVAWPFLDPTSTDPNLPYYQSFYTQVVQQAKLLGFWISMSSGISSTGNVNYAQYPSIDTVFQGRRAQAWWMAKYLQPDWVTAGAEPTTDKQILRGIPDVSRFDATYWGNHFALLMAGKPSGTPTKYAGGASPHDAQALYDAVVATAVDGIDQHPFPLTNSLVPVGKQFWNFMLSRFDQSRAAGKAILVTQTSPYKESAVETASRLLSSNGVYLRDVWDGFQPQDQAWEAMWQQIVLKKGLTATTYFWGNRTFLGGYIPYDPLLTYASATQQADNASWTNVQNPSYVMNAEGQLWASFVTGVPPSTPTPTSPSAPTSTPSPTGTAASTSTPTRGPTTTPTAGGPPAALTVTGVASNNSSVKVSFLPVPGAKDYRVYDVADPMTVKYAGMTHLDAGIPYHFVMASGTTPVYPYTTALNSRTVKTPQTLDVPATQIEWNKGDDRLPHTLVVQALDQLGPVPGPNLTDNANNPLLPGGMPGANEGPTLDGNMSINGQGPTTSSPTVLAQSTPFTVQANGSYAAIPSKSTAVQTFFDTFENSEGSTIAMSGPVDSRKGTMQYTLNGGTPKASTLFFEGADTDHSMPMIDAGHFMDVLFEGLTPSSLPPAYAYTYHQAYANMSLSPNATADLSGGQLLHLTEEVDSHLSGTNRWLAFQLAPAGDPLTEFQADDFVTNGGSPQANTRAVNTSNQALWVQLFPKMCDMALYYGTKPGTTNVPLVNTFLPQLVQGAQPSCYSTRTKQHFGGNGVGFDNRERWDLFLTMNHIALFEDGVMLIQADIPNGGLPFAQAKVYFTHYVYALADGYEKRRLQQSAPYETYWLNLFKYSDERHWDNMGFEVLPTTAVPAGNDFSSLASLIALPPVLPPASVALAR